jgi:hypothetical protein
MPGALEIKDCTEKGLGKGVFSLPGALGLLEDFKSQGFGVIAVS